jgi:hypothetical protein
MARKGHVHSQFRSCRISDFFIFTAVFLRSLFVPLIVAACEDYGQ